MDRLGEGGEATGGEKASMWAVWVAKLQTPPPAVKSRTER